MILSGFGRKSKQASLVAQLVKNLPAMWETGVQSLGWEDSLEKGMATLSRPWNCRVRHDLVTFTSLNP